jgi:hypothetical protein
MPSNNLKQVLVNAASLPASLEASLPEGVPKISSMLTNVAASLPTTPDLPMAIPDLPTMPAFNIPGVPGMAAAKAETPAPTTVRRRAPAFNFQ